MKKLLVSLAVLFSMIAGISTAAYAQEANTIEILPTMNTESSAQNRIWVGTFQLVWNEVVDNIVGKPIKFVDYNSIVAKNLNKKSFKKSNISDDSYYTKYGEISPDLKAEIEKGIKEKFDETSDIIDMYDWSRKPGMLFVYAMLKKDFKFLNAFDKLTPTNFGQNYTSVEYFGINEDSDKKLYKNVDVLFYNSKDDFAVKLYTKGNDVVMLYRTNDDKAFDKYFADANKKAKKYKGSKKFEKFDDLRVPDIKLYQEASFKDIENHAIKGSNFVIDETIETVDFRMDNEGVKLKSEAALIMKMSMPIQRGRDFLFTDKFVLFLIEKGQKTPYYAMRVSDVEALNKTGRD